MGILLANLPAFAFPEAAYFSPLAAGGTVPRRPHRLVSQFRACRRADARPLLLPVRRLAAAGRKPRPRRRAKRPRRPRPAHGRLVRHRAGAPLLGLVGRHPHPLCAGRPRRLPLHPIGHAHADFVGMRLSPACLPLRARRLPGPARQRRRATPPSRSPPGTTLRAASEFPPRPISRPKSRRCAAAGSTRSAGAGPTPTAPSSFVLLIGPQTLSAMLFGMAAFRSGMLSGEWDRPRLERWALIGLGLSFAAYAIIGLMTLDSGFDQRSVYFGSIVASEPFRMLGVAGYAASSCWPCAPAAGSPPASPRSAAPLSPTISARRSSSPRSSTAGASACSRIGRARRSILSRHWRGGPC